MGDDWKDIDYDVMIEALAAVIGEHLPRHAETDHNMMIMESILDDALNVITHPLGIVSSHDGLADRVIGAGSCEAFSVDDGAQGGVGLS